MLDLASLNEHQRAAVEAELGPALVLAGAGSGKTRVLTYRIAHLLSHHRVPAHQVAAVTFTNKAAGEMAERVERLVGPAAGSLTVTTFHALGVRILRREARHLGYGQNFLIYDDSDSLTLIKRVLADLSIDAAKVSPRMFRGLIDRAKNNLQSPSDVAEGALHRDVFPKVYERYRRVVLTSRLKID